MTSPGTTTTDLASDGELLFMNVDPADFADPSFDVDTLKVKDVEGKEVTGQRRDPDPGV